MPALHSAPIVGIGELLWDLLPTGPRLGGTTANFSILCARLGRPAALVSSLGGDDLGQRAREQLRSLVAGTGFSLEHIQTSKTLPTGTVSVALDAEGRPRYTIHEPVAWDRLELVPQLLDLAAAASVVCFGTLAQRLEPSRSTIRTFLQATSPACVRVCDVNLRAPFCNAETLQWCLRHATVLKISDEELAEVSRLLELGLPTPPSVQDVDAFHAWAIHATGTVLGAAPQCRLVAITLGPHGSLLADRSGTHRHPGVPTQVADTIGAGDAFTAGLTHAYLAGASLDRIAQVANLCGSFVASRQGATPELPTELLHTIHTTLAN